MLTKASRNGSCSTMYSLGVKLSCKREDVFAQHHSKNFSSYTNLHFGIPVRRQALPSTIPPLHWSNTYYKRAYPSLSPYIQPPFSSLLALPSYDSRYQFQPPPSCNHPLVAKRASLFENSLRNFLSC